MPVPAQILSWDPEWMQEQIDAYFEGRIGIRKVFPRDGDPFEEEYVKPPTFSGLANALGISRMTMWRYVHRRDDLDPQALLVLTRACDKIAELVEEATFNRETYQGARFALEVNHRYGREEDGQGLAGGFVQKIVTPAIRADDEPLAIPKWEGDDDDE